jgi:hypothetical protein
MCICTHCPQHYFATVLVTASGNEQSVPNQSLMNIEQRCRECKSSNLRVRTDKLQDHLKQKQACSYCS